MRRLMFAFSLLAALSGTPLRQAEAAHDLACSLAELGDGDLVEEVDGGVGDDSGETIRGDSPADPVDRAGGMLLLPPILSTCVLSVPTSLPLRAGPPRRGFERGAPSRCALWQRFRF